MKIHLKVVKCCSVIHTNQIISVFNPSFRILASKAKIKERNSFFFFSFQAEFRRIVISLALPKSLMKSESELISFLISVLLKNNFW